MRRGTILVLSLVSLVGLAACGDEDPVDGNARESAVLEAIIREVVEPASGDEPTPVVHVVGRDGTGIGIDVQAAVVAGTADEYDVRFADDRADVVDSEADDAPVHDGGVLLAVGEIPPDGTSIEVDVERYESASSSRDLVVSLRWVDPSWSVTSLATVDAAG